MNPSKQKKGDHCLNCGRKLDIEKDNFCPACGQLNHSGKDSAFTLVKELVSDFLHFDSKVFRTVIPLLFRPGYLTAEYNSGRVRYLHPVRMFITVTVIMFIIQGFGSAKKASKKPLENISGPDTTVIITMDDVLSGNQGKMHIDSGNNKRNTTNVSWDLGAEGNEKISNEKLQRLIRSGVTDPKALLDSIGAEKTIFKTFVASQIIKGNMSDPGDIKRYFLSKMPWILFCMVPFFAMLLMFFFRKSGFLYVDHLVTAFHLHTALFILIIIQTLINKMFNSDSSLIYLYSPVLYFVSIHRIYKLNRLTTVLRGIITGIFYFLLGIVFTIAIMVFLFYMY